MNPQQEPSTPANHPARLSFLGMKAGGLAGTTLGSGLATWYLLLGQPPAKIDVGPNFWYCFYLLTNLIGLALLGAIVGLCVGLCLGAVLDVARER
jgi:hypothetical protein